MVTSDLPFRRVATIAYRLLSINGRRPCLENTRPFTSAGVRDTILARPKVDRKLYVNGFGIRSYTSMPKYDAFAQERIRGYSSSMFLSRLEERGYAHFNIPGLEKKESNEDLCVFLCMPGVTIQDVKVCVEQNTWLDIKAKTETHDQLLSYQGRMRLPANVDKTSSNIKGEMQPDGVFKLAFPKLKDKEMIKTSSIFEHFRFKLRLRFLVSVVRPLMIQIFLFKGLCAEENDSFTMYTEVTADTCLHMSVTYGKFEKMELTREGACVSLNMPELKIEDVKSYFKGDILLIKGKTRSKTNKNKNKMHYYFTGIRLPKSILKKRNMIETEMTDGMYKATLPYVTAEIKIN